MDAAQKIGDEREVGGVLEVMNPTGHYEVRWGKEPEEVAMAETQFKDLLSKGYVAFKKTWIGTKGKKAEEFDPKARAYLFQKSAKPVEKKTEKVEAEKVEEDEFEHQQTKEFDKKADHTLVPPLRGG